MFTHCQIEFCTIVWSSCSMYKVWHGMGPMFSIAPTVWNLGEDC